MKKLLSCLLVTVLLLSALSVCVSAEDEFILPTKNWGADEDGIFRIGSAADLLAFAANNATNNNYFGKTVLLTADIDMKNAEWAMMNAFKGTLDGQGFAIKNLNLSTSGVIAFINKLNNCTIQNIRFIDGSVSTTGTGAFAAVIGGSTTGTCVFRNVYTKMNVVSAGVRASGFIAYAETDSVPEFYNCVSDCTLTGARCGGFIAQLNNPGVGAKFTDCAFIGDLSNAGIMSAGFIGIFQGDVELTRCVSIGKGNDRTNNCGQLIYLDHCNVDYGGETVVLNDCYAAVDKLNGIGLFHEDGALPKDRSFRYDLTIKYGGETVYHKNAATETDTLWMDSAAIHAAFKTIDSTLTKANLATVCPALSGWDISETETVTYGTDKTIALLVPAGALDLISGKSAPEPVTPPEPVVTDKPEPTTTKPKPETTTEAPVTTAPPTEATDPVKPQPQKRGCSGTVGIGLAVLLTAGCGAAITLRKREK